MSPDTVSPPAAGRRTDVPPVWQGALEAAPPAALEARRRVQALVRSWGRNIDEDAAALLTSELVSNAVRYGGGTVVLAVRVAESWLRVDVRDASPVLPRAADPGDDAEGGRGLLLVDAVAETWGSYSFPGGKTVYFTLGPGPDQDRGHQAAAPAAASAATSAGLAAAGGR